MITDNQDEIFDIVDGNDQVIGKARRGEVHGNKYLIHRSIGVIVVNDKGEIFLQQRSNTKDTDPLKWTISVSGHVERGDTYENAAKRELQEEIGINVPIIPFDKFIYRGEQETEVSQLFKAISNGPFQLNKEEIIQGKFFTRKELIRLIKSGKIELSNMGKETLKHFGWKTD
jgi:isopentenyl-diphosphate delta-isomerase type 1